MQHDALLPLLQLAASLPPASTTTVQSVPARAPACTPPLVGASAACAPGGAPTSKWACCGAMLPLPWHALRACTSA